MARLAIATALLAATSVLASAQGPSYEGRGYGGPLYVGPNFQGGGQHSPPIYDSKSTSKERSNKKRVHRATKERKESPAKATETAKSTPATSQVETENSSLSAASTGPEAKGSEQDVATKGIETENSTISGEPLETGATSTAATAGTGKSDQPQAKQNVGCKKYFPSAGMTLSVPCE
jgi:hypothetical protein